MPARLRSPHPAVISWAPDRARPSSAAVARAIVGAVVGVVRNSNAKSCHTASIFPGTYNGIDDTKLVVANWVEQFKTWRITLTPHVINDATHVVITTGGITKADALHGALDGPHDPNLYPVQLVAPTDGELHWLIDEAAAAKLARRAGAAGRSSFRPSASWNLG